MEGKSFLWFPFWYFQFLSKINKIFVENICNFVFFWCWTLFLINVIFWLYCEPFSVKKGLQNFQKFLFFILSLVEIQLLKKFFFAFLFSFRTRFRCFFMLLDPFLSHFYLPYFKSWACHDFLQEMLGEVYYFLEL